MEVTSMFSFSFERSNQPTLALQERVDPVETGAGRGEALFLTASLLYSDKKWEVDIFLRLWWLSPHPPALLLKETGCNSLVPVK